MQSTSQTASRSRAQSWAGRIIPSVVVVFLLFDAVTKILKVSYVMQATTQLGISADLIPGLGALLLVCTGLYVIPPTAALGAVLLTGYLGGAVVVNLRVGHSAFETLFPVIVGALAWAGLCLRDARLRILIPGRAQ